MEKGWPSIYYGFAYDRAGNLWKVWMSNKFAKPFPHGENNTTQWEQFGVDVQLGYSTHFHMAVVPDKPAVNVVNFTEDYFTPANVRRLAK